MGKVFIVQEEKCVQLYKNKSDTIGKVEANLEASWNELLDKDRPTNTGGRTTTIVARQWLALTRKGEQRPSHKDETYDRKAYSYLASTHLVPTVFESTPIPQVSLISER